MQLLRSSIACPWTAGSWITVDGSFLMGLYIQEYHGTKSWHTTKMGIPWTYIYRNTTKMDLILAQYYQYLDLRCVSTEACWKFTGKPWRRTSDPGDQINQRLSFNKPVPVFNFPVGWWLSGIIPRDWGSSVNWEYLGIPSLLFQVCWMTAVNWSLLKWLLQIVKSDWSSFSQSQRLQVLTNVGSHQPLILKGIINTYHPSKQDRLCQNYWVFRV